MKRLAPLAALPFLLAANTPPGDIAYDLVEGMTTEVGPRLAGTEQEARARDWAVKKLRAMGFANVHVEPFAMPVWRRGAESAEVVGAMSQKLAVTALGRSGATPPEGLTLPVVQFDSMAALDAAAPGSLTGKIAFVTHRMVATTDGVGYGFFGDIRRRGPAVAAAKGASAIVIRSIGSDSSRAPHTGGTNWPDGVTPIPAGALSVVDSEQLERLLARGPVVLHLTLTPTFEATGQSGNVVAEIPGRDPKAGIVLIGGHLDSWDLGTGAIDDASGIGATTAAAKVMLDSGKRPRRTVRVVWFGAEEPGLFGGNAYAQAHRGEPHALATEADLGSGRVWRVEFNLPDGAADVRQRVIAALAPLGVSPSAVRATGDSDVGPTVALGVSAIDLNQDATRYFDLHHTPEDTLDKVDKADLAQVAEAYIRVLAIVANAPEDLIQPRKP
jgi:carboxypeptidase Q